MTKINQLALRALALLLSGFPHAVILSGCNPFPGQPPVTPDQAPPVVYEVATDGGLATIAAWPGEWASVAIEGAVIRFRVASGPGEAPALACPCPDFAHPWHPGVLAEDPDHPGECVTRSRTGQWMDARQHPRCQEEARERAGREGR